MNPFRRPPFVRLGCLAAALALSAAAHGQTPAKPAPTPVAAKAAKPATQPSPEEQAFRNNCSRCHNAPEGFSPRIAGTVVKHMRVRANLTPEDQKLIMSFFAP